MGAQKLTNTYRQQIDRKLAEFRRVTTELRDMLGALEFPDYADLTGGGGLGLTADEISLIMPDDSDDDDPGRN